MKEIEKIYSWLTTDAVAANAPTFVHPRQADQQSRLSRQRHNFHRYTYLRQRSLRQGGLYQTPEKIIEVSKQFRRSTATFWATAWRAKSGLDFYDVLSQI